MEKIEYCIGFGGIVVMGTGMLIWDSVPLTGTVLCLIGMGIVAWHAIRGGYWMW